MWVRYSVKQSLFFLRFSNLNPEHGVAFVLRHNLFFESDYLISFVCVQVHFIGLGSLSGHFIGIK